MFTKTARFYDLLYRWKDYAQEVGSLRELINIHHQTGGDRLLDVACGTGKHLEYLQEFYEVQGLDLDAELLKAARHRLPDVALHQADMITFDLNQHFDIVTCLFSSIGYVGTVEKLHQAISAMARHTRPAGLVLVEAWIYPQDFRAGYVSSLSADDGDIKITRMAVSQQRDNVSLFDFHYLIGTPDGIQHVTERHELALFTHQHYLDAFQQAGLTIAHYDEVGISGRGLYVGRRS